MKATYEAARAAEAKATDEVTEDDPSPEKEIVVETLKDTLSGKTVTMRGPWTLPEQRLLEDAMRSVSKEDVDRWDQISLKVGRSRKECIQRVKDLALRLKESKEN